MTAKARDYSILDKLELERKPVGVKFVSIRPKGIERIGKRLSFCEMLKEAQTAAPFYVQREDLFCIEPFILGMEEADPMLVGGLVGEADELFEEARANRKLYQFLPKMVKGSVKYVAFSSVDQLNFDPDVVIFTVNAGQAYHILRALNYSSGDIWSAKGTSVAACAWIYLYPVISGEMNLTITGISLGMRALKVFPEGLVIISLPWPKLDETLKNLRNMKWKLLSDEITGEAHKKRVDKLFNDLSRKVKES